MEITLELVEKVKRHTKASFEDAKAALERTEGNVLDAIILLEKEGHAQVDVGHYATHGGATASVPRWKTAKEQKKDQAEQSGKEGWQEVRRVMASLLRNSVQTRLEVYHRERFCCRMPLLVLVLLCVVVPWFIIPMAVIGIMCGCHYRFTGPERVLEKVNKALETVEQTLDTVRRDLTGNKKENP